MVQEDTTGNSSVGLTCCTKKSNKSHHVKMQKCLYLLCIFCYTHCPNNKHIFKQKHTDGVCRYNKWLWCCSAETKTKTENHKPPRV
uniref:Uncharacterized protein n=1 Tax=Labrus bergylta TaxID=56723 RepID=A0A3Q3L3W4_9LABR